MYKNWIPKFPMVATSALLMGCCVLFATSAVAASCGDRTLQGNYGFHAEGTLSPAPNITLTFRAVGMTHFDGDGHATWVEHTVIGGVSVAPGFTPASGTYTVNSDCTGTAVINTPDSPVPLHLSFIVVNGGKDVHSVLATDAVSTEFTKVDD
jgi:hypothetical protein